MISAQRFKLLDRETNIGVAPFSSDLDAGVLNSVTNSFDEVNATLESLIASASQKAKSEIEALKDISAQDALDAATRTAKGMGGKITDLMSLPEAKLSELMGEFSDGNAQVSKSLMGIMKTCSGRGMGYGLPGRPYDPSINCGAGEIKVGTSGSSASCNASSYGNLLSKLTGGSYGSVFSDFNSALRKVMALAGYGYNLGMCGVLGAVSGGLPNDVMSKASGGLLGLVGMAGNTNAVLDIAKSSVGLLPLTTNPMAIETFLSNYKKPSNTTEAMLSGLSDRTVAGLELLDDNWGISDYDGSLSICKAPGYSKDLDSAWSASLTDRSFGAADLDNAPIDDLDFMFASYSMA